jgi:hypothetical protein
LLVHEVDDVRVVVVFRVTEGVFAFDRLRGWVAWAEAEAWRHVEGDDGLVWELLDFEGGFCITVALRRALRGDWVGSKRGSVGGTFLRWRYQGFGLCRGLSDLLLEGLVLVLNIL